MSACFWLLLVPTFEFKWLLLIDAIAVATKQQLQLEWPEFGCSHVLRMLQWWWMGRAALWDCVWVCLSHLLSSITAAGLNHLLFEKFCSQSSSKTTACCWNFLLHVSHTLNCCNRGMPVQKVPCWCVSVLWCVIDILARVRLVWSQLRKSPGTWLIYVFMQTD